MAARLGPTKMAAFQRATLVERTFARIVLRQSDNRELNEQAAFMAEWAEINQRRFLEEFGRCLSMKGLTNRAEKIQMWSTGLGSGPIVEFESRLRLMLDLGLFNGICKIPHSSIEKNKDCDNAICRDFKMHLYQDAVYWVEGTIIGVDSNREFCYLACRVCGKKVEEVAGKKWCLHCRAFTFTNIFRYNVEIVVADESDTAKMTLWNRATQKLLGEPAEDVISLYGDTARVMPDDIAEKILGREGLFEVVICSQRSHDDGFTVSRLTVDDEIKDAYIMRNFPAAYEPSSEDESFQATLDYVEEKDRASHN
ncbi:hypothetical protein CASFOL_031503 [Castilleja foliolosa]|uniref:Replication factor A C-terminal domain-containing protein n=1 Tax=Castilleja foliolosa TaxID=1961234 RepID=A0ABD3C7M8_9LAMI